MVAYGDVALGPPSTPWWLVLLEGIAAVLIGFMLITETSVTLFTLILFLGAYWLVIGILDLVMLFVDRRQWGWKLFSGVIGVIAGLAVIRHPLWASWLIPTTLVWILGILGIGIGIATLARSFMGGGWASAILGLISIALGVILLLNTTTSARVLVYAAGIVAIIGGAGAIAGAFWLRSQERELKELAHHRPPMAPA